MSTEDLDPGGSTSMIHWRSVFESKAIRIPKCCSFCYREVLLKLAAGFLGETLVGNPASLNIQSWCHIYSALWLKSCFHLDTRAFPTPREGECCVPLGTSLAAWWCSWTVSWEFAALSLRPRPFSLPFLFGVHWFMWFTSFLFLEAAPTFRFYFVLLVI